MEKGFTTMHDKIQSIEGRVDHATVQIEDYERLRGEKERENK
jgi:predicted LPLAT superfamily acyltransferase